MSPDVVRFADVLSEAGPVALHDRFSLYDIHFAAEGLKEPIIGPPRRGDRYRAFRVSGNFDLERPCRYQSEIDEFASELISRKGLPKLCQVRFRCHTALFHANA